MITRHSTEALTRLISTRKLPWLCGGGSACLSAAERALNRSVAKASTEPTTTKMKAVT